jgi:hypothetical protein
VPGAREQLGTAALLVPPDSPRKIAEGIKRLRDDATVRESLRDQGKRRAASWTGNDYIRGILAIIDEFDAIRRCWA